MLNDFLKISIFVIITFFFFVQSSQAAVLYAQSVYDTQSAIPVLKNYPAQSNVITDVSAPITIKGIAVFVSENYCGSINLFDTTTKTFSSPFNQQGPNNSLNPREVLYINPEGFNLTEGHSYNLIFGCNARDGTWNGSFVDNYGGATSSAGSSGLTGGFGADAEVADYSFAICDSTDCSLEETPQQNPSFSNPGQFKSDGLTEIYEGGITTEDNVVFKAKVTSPANSQVKLQVELKRIDQPFDESGIIESDFVSSDSIATAVASSLTNGNYKWRTRAVDEQGNKSDWQEFGAVGNIDFEVKLVPLYTQGLSIYPSIADTDEWDGLIYANGRGAIDPDGPGPEKPCGLEIWRCGCAITSMVMLGRYYDIVTGIDNTNIDPNHINNWLTNNDGYTTYGRLRWSKAVEYLGFVDQTTGKKMAKLEFNWQTDWNVSSVSPRINNFLDSAQPIVAYSKKFGHYFIIDIKLANTYKVKDPAWYNTKTLSDAENLADYTRGYNNHFDTANLFTYIETPKQFSPAIHLILASPAELLITDSSGNKLGKDPISGISYNQIPNGVYGEESPIITSDTPLEESEIHKTKEIHIQDPVDGNYNIQVIGTGDGEYAIDSLVYDADNNSHSQTFTGNTAPNLITDYILNFTPEEPENIIIQDASDNTLRLVFDKLKQKKKEIKAELESLQYNNQQIIGLPRTELKFEWSLNKDQTIKELEQKIEVKNQFTVKAKYNHQKDETKIKIKERNKKETEQILPGLVIIKLITKSGSLEFEF